MNTDRSYYVLTHHYQGDPALYGVFSTPEEAKKAIEQILDDDWYEEDEKRHFREWCRITKVKIDEIPLDRHGDYGTYI